MVNEEEFENMIEDEDELDSFIDVLDDWLIYHL